MADRWEYKSIMVGGPSLEDELRPLGEQGWEVVGFAPVLYSPSNYVHDRYVKDIILTVTEWSAGLYRILLKRRKP